MTQAHYAQLEMGARYLAAAAADAEERRTHLGWANRYYRLGLEARLEEMELPAAQAA